MTNTDSENLGNSEIRLCRFLCLEGCRPDTKEEWEKMTRDSNLHFMCSVYQGRGHLNNKFHTDCDYNPEGPGFIECPRYQEAKDKSIDVIAGRSLDMRDENGNVVIHFPEHGPPKPLEE